MRRSSENSPAPNNPALREFLSEYAKRCFALSALRRGVCDIKSEDVALRKPLELPSASSPAMRVFIGGAVDAYSPATLEALQITHIINCSFEYDCIWQEGVLERLFDGILDGGSANAGGGKSICSTCTKQHFPSFIVQGRFKINWKLLLQDLSDLTTAAAGSSTVIEPQELYDRAKAFRDRQHIQYAHFPLRDALDQDLMEHVPELVAFCRRIISSDVANAGLLFHCKAGVSRSVSMGLVYLMRICNLSLGDAFDIVQKHRPTARPNSNFALQLLKLYRRSHPEQSDAFVLEQTARFRQAYAPILSMEDVAAKEEEGDDL